MKIVRERLLEEDEIRFSGRHIPSNFKRPRTKKPGEEGIGDPYDKRGPRTYTGKATKDEFNKVLGAALQSKNIEGEEFEFTPREYGLHIKPFKEKVTRRGLLNKFDKVPAEVIRRDLLLSLDATELPNVIRIYIEEKIINANTELKLAELVLKYTIDSRNPETLEKKKITMENIFLNQRQHTSDQLRELDRIRKF